MSLSPTEIRNVARLARLNVTPEEIAALDTHFKNLFNLIDALQAVDTTDVAPLSHPHEIAMRLRDDVVTETDHRQAYQAVAPQVEKGLYLVPKVIE